MGEIKKKIEDWMVRVSFAEADAAREGFQLTGVKLDHKSRLALDRLRVLRRERASRKETGEGMDSGEEG